MRTSLLRLGALMLLAAGTATSQQHQFLPKPPVASTPQVPMVLKVPATEPVNVTRPNFVMKSDESTQSITWSNMFTTRFGPTWESFNLNEMFTYDAGTNTLAMVQCTTEAGTPATGIVNVVLSTDGGSNWSRSEVFRRSNELLLMPGISIVNQGTTNFADVYWALTGYNYVGNSTGYTLNNTVTVFRDETGVFDVPMEGPENNNSGGLVWQTGSLAPVGGDNPSVLFISQPYADGQPFGAYGVWGWDFTAQDYTTNTMPSQFAMSNLPPVPLGSYNTVKANIGSDEDGRYYMVVNNTFADAPDDRVPAVSFSEDQGATWTTLSRMPANLYEAYRTQYGWQNIRMYDPWAQFTGTDLLVTGVNQFSYFFRVYQLNEAGTSVINIDIVEAKYNNGTWTLTRVAELNGFPLEFARAKDPSDAISIETGWLPSLDNSRSGHELEVARAADGGGYVLKWIDEAPELGAVQFGKTTTVYFRQNQNDPWQEFQYDSMYTTDVYFSYRTPTGSWSPKVNVTKDVAYDHGTRMPAVVPSLSKVPLIGLRPLSLDQYNPQYGYLPALRELPSLIYDGTIDQTTVSIIQYGSFNTTTSVEEEAETFNFRFNAVSPNPATNEAEVAFTTDAASKVMVEVFSTNGTRMATVLNTELGAGIHALTIDASNYASGTYYVALTVGGQRLTQPLVIVK